MANRKQLRGTLDARGAIVCATAGETCAFAQALARELAPGAVLSLEGPLGAGKTQFVKGLARGAGFGGEVSSPTFTLLHEYVGGRLPVFHFDLYRLESADDVIALGFDDYLDAGGIVAVEWGDRFPGLIDRGARRIRFEFAGEARRISWEGAD